MKYSVFLVGLLVAAGLACNKGKFDTKPSLELKSKNGDIIPVNGVLVLEFEFTDKEGDVSNKLYVKKIRTNQRAVPTVRDSFALDVPDFPKNPRGIIEARLEYNNYLISAQNPPRTGNPPRNENDTLTLKFALKDKADNISDTVTIPDIIVIR